MEPISARHVVIIARAVKAIHRVGKLRANSRLLPVTISRCLNDAQKMGNRPETQYLCALERKGWDSNPRLV